MPRASMGDGFRSALVVSAAFLARLATIGPRAAAQGPNCSTVRAASASSGGEPNADILSTALSRDGNFCTSESFNTNGRVVEWLP